MCVQHWTVYGDIGKCQSMDEDQDKTTFSSVLGTYCYTRMPFTLRNELAVFGSALDTIQSGAR